MNSNKHINKVNLLKRLRLALAICLPLILIYFIFFSSHLEIIRLRFPLTLGSMPAITWNNKPFKLKSKIEVNGSLINVIGSTTAADNSIFQASATRELISKNRDLIKTSMLPHVGEIIYENPMDFTQDNDRSETEPLNSYGLVKSGFVKFKVAMHHPYIQAFGQTLDSMQYRFDKFHVVTFKIKILNCTINCPPDRPDDSISANWVDFSEEFSVPIKVYPSRPSDVEIDQIQRYHDSGCSRLGIVETDDERCQPKKLPTFNP